MHRLRNRLIAAFLAATVLPLVATFWITTSLLDRSLGYATTGELDRLSRTLEATVRQFYQRERDALKQEALAGRTPPVVYSVADETSWPGAVRAFWDSGESERFGISGSGGDHVDYMRRSDGTGGQPRGVATYRRDLRGLHMDQLTAELRQTRQLVESLESRDLRRGFTLTLILLLAATWIAGLVPVILIANRISRPIQQLTGALTDFAGSDWSQRLDTGRASPASSRDEVGRAVDAFNQMADQLQRSRERLVHLTRMDSWQSLARKTAHEVKNSLTPIRLTVEEMQARQPAGGSRLHGPGRPDRGQRDRVARAARPRLLGVLQRAAGRPADPRRERAGHRTRRVVAARASGDALRSQARCSPAMGARGRGSREGHPDESPAERGGSRRARRLCRS